LRQESIARLYDRALKFQAYSRYYEDAGYFNFGYWGTGAKSQRDASDALVDQLVQRIPVRSGRILDVACGAGGTTKRLTLSYEPEKITAINISEAQLNAARDRVPGATFLCMNATELKFPAEYFDAVLCVEAAHHFDTRQTFFREAFRVLKPEGSLVLSDMLFKSYPRFLARFDDVPLANQLPDIASYHAQLASAGFAAVSIEDVTDACMKGFQRHLAGWPASEYRKGRMSLPAHLFASVFSKAFAGSFTLACKSYIMAVARKPLLDS
jgi:ubiquinone/menaquinone biosynthesis C-methylase UbiE